MLSFLIVVALALGQACCHQFKNFHNLFVANNSHAVLTLNLSVSEKNAIAKASITIENNWMFMRNTFDVVYTTSPDERDKILNPTESCQLVKGTTYTYVQDELVLHFSANNSESKTGKGTSELKTELSYIIILNNQRISPKSFTADLYLDVTVDFEVKKENKIEKIRDFTIVTLFFTVWLLLSLVSKKLKKEVMIYEKVKEHLKITN